MNAGTAKRQNTIILSHDFTEASCNAALFAASLCHTLHCTLLLFHVIVPGLNREEQRLVTDTGALIEEAEKKLEHQKHTIPEQCGVEIAVQVKAVSGSYFSELQTLCSLVNPYAVITGNHGRNSGLAGRFRHRNAYIMRHLPWTSVSVPAGWRATVDKIGLACDCRGIIYDLPLDEIKALATQLQAELHIIIIVKPEKSDPVVEFEYGLLKHRLKEMAPFYHFIPATDAGTAICEATRRHQLNLLIVVPRQHSLWQRLFYKSESQKLALQCPVPVMVIR